MQVNLRIVTEMLGATMGQPISQEAYGGGTSGYVTMPGEAKEVRLLLTHDACEAMLWKLIEAGRNFNEVLRVLDSLQLTDREKLATPGNWQPGDEAIIVPAVSDEQARELFPQGFKTIKPYLRTVQPK